ncbi:hypothetical protein MINT15_36190 [Saccharomonospora viridis]|uniref:Uncharacterized protein n=1 Tax=Saccharomonospora viridis TaxID=1852 RepID=A0A837D6Y3_9PSEU|nr:hypothetical protein MINT15_36190 [Saccharomonospora viridis]
MRLAVRFASRIPPSVTVTQRAGVAAVDESTTYQRVVSSAGTRASAPLLIGAQVGMGG